MKMKVVSIFDTGVGAFTRPIFVRSDGEAIRMFIDQVNSERSPDGGPNVMFDHPDHFALFHIGEFDDADAKLSVPSQGVPVELVTGQRAKLVKS